jgi:magnesium transporter
MYYVGFSSATIVSSLILFQGFDTTDATNTVSLLAGFITTFLGVHLLNLSRKEREATLAPVLRDDDFSADIEANAARRSRLQGRLSIDGWHGIVEGGPPGSAHRRTSSRDAPALFDSLDDRPRHVISENVGLERLNEESESESSDDESDDSDLGNERTRLTTVKHGHGSRGNSTSRSPVQLS